MSPLTLRVFLSSPGDVADERTRARKVMEALEGGHLLRGKVRFEIVAWDDDHASAPMDGGESPQLSVNRYSGRPAECDLTLVILWSRIGTPLPQDITRADGTRYQSGTVWEYEDALSTDKPVYIYRRSTRPQIDLDDAELEAKRAQYTAVKGFFAQFTNADGSLGAGFNTYADPPSFETLLRQHLEAFLKTRLELGEQSGATVVEPDDARVARILTLVDELGRKNRQITEQEDAIGRLQRENDELRRAAVARTLTAAAQPDASKAAVAAANALEAGDSRPAEALLGKQERMEAKQVGRAGVDDAQQRRQAAALAREQGALAMGHDTRAALVAFQRAAEYEPNDTWTHFLFGDLLRSVGDLSSAMQSFERGAATIAARLSENADDPVAQRDLAVGHNRIGDVLVAQGDGTGALAAYRKGLTIAETLAARDADNTEWQRDLSVSVDRIGDVLVAQAEKTEALAMYHKGLAIAEVLAARDAANTVWQRDLAASHTRIGDVLVAQSQLIEALAAYRKSLAIAETLVAADAHNSDWQRDLAVSHNRIGDVLWAQDERSEALAAYRKGLEIAETLTARDAANTEWQRDLAVSHNKIGDALKAEGDEAGALARYRSGLAIAEELVARDPSNAQWQTDIAYSCSKLGVLEYGQPVEERRGYLVRGREILAKLKAQGRLLPSVDWIGWFDLLLEELPPDQE